MNPFAVVACGVLGLLVGSFANVVIERVPEGRSVVSPRSACPGCGAVIATRDNVPVLSWVLLRGRCRACGEPIGVRYPLVEVGCATLFALVGARIGLDWSLPAFLLFTWTLLVVAVVDLRTRRIPDRLTYPLTPALAVLVVAAGLLSGDPGSAVRALASALIAFAVMFGLLLVNPRGMGGGDVKLAPFLGLGLGYLGWGALVLGLFGAFVIGGVLAIVLLVAGRVGRKSKLPFGPSLSAAALVTLLFGGTIIDAYLRATGLA